MNFIFYDINETILNIMNLGQKKRLANSNKALIQEITFLLKNELKRMDCTVNDVEADIHSKTISVGLEDECLLSGNGLSNNLKRIQKIVKDLLVKQYAGYDISVCECETLWAGKVSEGMVYNGY